MHKFLVGSSILKKPNLYKEYQVVTGKNGGDEAFAIFYKIIVKIHIIYTVVYNMYNCNKKYFHSKCKYFNIFFCEHCVCNVFYEKFRSAFQLVSTLYNILHFMRRSVQMVFFKAGAPKDPSPKALIFIFICNFINNNKYLKIILSNCIYIKILLYCGRGYAQSSVYINYGTLYTKCSNIYLHISKYKLILTSLFRILNLVRTVSSLLERKINFSFFIDKGIFKIYNYMCMCFSLIFITLPILSTVFCKKHNENVNSMKFTDAKTKKKSFSQNLSCYVRCFLGTTQSNTKFFLLSINLLFVQRSFFILGSIFLFITIYSNIILYIYLYQICFIISIDIYLINITYNFIKNKELWYKKYPELYSIVRYLLLGMLFISLIITVILFFLLINYLIHLIWNIILVNIKGSTSYTQIWNNIKSSTINSNKSPKNPKNPNTSFFTVGQSKDHKDIKKKLYIWKKNY
uniref:Uncharacterized protein n=1 Tax=Hirsutella vermicola TaxID=369263 RepID=A0A1S6KM12_9HYPO|nr:hypothetical protein [Hirsutella vermicola]AQT19622.1 hypothetical protein [Hirsutella vermicola]